MFLKNNVNQDDVCLFKKLYILMLNYLIIFCSKNCIPTLLVDLLLEPDFLMFRLIIY